MHLQHRLDSSCDITTSTGGCIPASLRNIAHSELRISDHGDGVIPGRLHQPQPQNTTVIDSSDNSRENFGTTPSTTLILYIIASAAWFQHTIRRSAHYAICQNWGVRHHDEADTAHANHTKSYQSHRTRRRQLMRRLRLLHS